jgi:uncharacterized protein
MPRVVHFEIPAEDPKRATAFYESVFGWKFSAFGGQDYWLAKTGETGEPGIDGAIMKREDPKQPVTNSISVPSIDQFAKKVEAAGGKMVVAKVAIPTVGYYAYFTDPEGNIQGLWENDAEAK